MHAMIDIETMGTTRDCVILTIGASLFDPNAEGHIADLYMRVDMQEQINMGRTVDQATLDWWKKQDDAVMNEAFDPDSRVSVEYAAVRLAKFLSEATAFWSQGPTFDMIILEDLYAQLGRSVPWRYSRVRDSRTLFAVLGDPRKNRQAAHNALADCHYQIQGVQACYQQIAAFRSNG